MPPSLCIRSFRLVHKDEHLPFSKPLFMEWPNYKAESTGANDLAAATCFRNKHRVLRFVVLHMSSPVCTIIRSSQYSLGASVVMESEEIENCLVKQGKLPIFYLLNSVKYAFNITPSSRPTPSVVYIFENGNVEEQQRKESFTRVIEEFLHNNVLFYEKINE